MYASSCKRGINDGQTLRVTCSDVCLACDTVTVWVYVILAVGLVFAVVLSAAIVIVW